MHSRNMSPVMVFLDPAATERRLLRNARGKTFSKMRDDLLTEARLTFALIAKIPFQVLDMSCSIEI